MQIISTIDQTSSKSSLQLKLDSLGLTDSSFGEFSGERKPRFGSKFGQRNDNRNEKSNYFFHNLPPFSAIKSHAAERDKPNRSFLNQLYFLITFDGHFSAHTPHAMHLS